MDCRGTNCGLRSCRTCRGVKYQNEQDLCAPQPRRTAAKDAETARAWDEAAQERKRARDWESAHDARKAERDEARDTFAAQLKERDAIIDEAMRLLEREQEGKYCLGCLRLLPKHNDDCPYQALRARIEEARR